MGFFAEASRPSPTFPSAYIDTSTPTAANTPRIFTHTEAWTAYVESYIVFFSFLILRIPLRHLPRQSRTPFTMWDGFFMLLALSTIMGVAYVAKTVSRHTKP